MESTTLERAADSQRNPDRTSDLIRMYLDDIAGIPLLRAEQELRLARRRRLAEAATLKFAARIPGVARSLHRTWLGLRADGKVTGLLSEIHDVREGSDRSAAVDSSMREIEFLLATEVAPEPGADLEPDSPGARVLLGETLGNRLAAHVIDLQPRLSMLESILDEMIVLSSEILSGRTSVQRRVDLEREVGLEAADFCAEVNRASKFLKRAREARRFFVTSNLRLVVHEAKRYRGMGTPFIDLIQHGNLGLIRAVEKFDDRRGYRFSTYAVWWIRQACVRGIQSTASTVRAPGNVHADLRRLRAEVARFQSLHGRAPDSEDLASAGFNERSVRALESAESRTLSLDEPLARGEGLTLGDTLVDESIAGSDRLADQRSMSQVLQRVVGSLDSRERVVVASRFGLNGPPPQTLQEIGDGLGLSRERVRQIEQQALEKLRGLEEVKGLQGLVSAG